MYTLTAADFADTGQWKLLINIRTNGLEAFLENTIHREIPPQTLCSVTWEPDRDMLKKNIENAVYNNPRLLDDFATRIIIFDKRTLFIPTEVAEQSPGAEEEIYQKVYIAGSADIMTDTDRDITAAWSLAPDVKSFVMRTFPGARITCNLMDKVRNFRTKNEGKRLHIIAREKEVDMILLDNQGLISASTHDWTKKDDIAYLTLNLLEVYEYSLKDIEVEISGMAADSESWEKIKGKVLNLVIKNHGE